MDYGEVEKAASGMTYEQAMKPPPQVARAVGIAPPGEKQPNEPKEDQ